jgi:hypothetical protein
MRRDDPMVHPGALKQAIRVLRWWGKDQGDDDIVIEMVKQGREAASALMRDLRTWERRLHRSGARAQQRRRPTARTVSRRRA